MILFSLLLIGAVIVVGLMYYYQSKIIKSNINHYLTQEKNTKFLKFNEILVKFGKEHRQDIEKKLIDAGVYNTNVAKYYFPLKISSVIILCLAIYLSQLSDTNKIIINILGFISILIVPDMLLAAKKIALIKKTSSKLPYMLDMMSVCIQTGMTIESALNYLGAELEAFDKDLCFQIRKTSDISNIHGLEKALNDFAARLPTPEVRSFTLTLIQNLQYGTSIAKVLSDSAEDMRKIQVLSVEEKIGKLSAKMSIPLILFIMFPIVILILAPGIMQMSVSIR
ncbi:type II secretion system F family protein [Photobacterium nomapromontoriensis]|uniref:type II secretion system F family protein n=1 Tax=Photobacterium nomapromontoriensis TaxID=2910237 RepID=UPI003D13062A